MIVSVSEFEKTYEFELKYVTQLCGQNILKKKYIIDSIKKYFSTYKYPEDDCKFRNNIRIDRNEVGRMFFNVYYISCKADIIRWINLSKQSILVEFIKYLIQKYDWQVHLNVIQDELDVMFQMINEQLSQHGRIELSYSQSDIWDIVQNSDVLSYDQTSLENQDEYELLATFISLLFNNANIKSKKILVIFDNIDHMVTNKQYNDLIEYLLEDTSVDNLYFIMSTSLEGYVKCKKTLCNGITIFNDSDFQFPEFENMYDFILNNYPCNKQITEQQVIEWLEKVIHKIGRERFLSSAETEIIIKLVNQTLMIDEKWDSNVSVPEIAFLKA